jgi:hypothetical protein
MLLLGCGTFAQYKRTDLVTDTGAGGTLADPSLVNAWGPHCEPRQSLLG